MKEAEICQMNCHLFDSNDIPNRLIEEYQFRSDVAQDFVELLDDIRGKSSDQTRAAELLCAKNQ